MIKFINIGSGSKGNATLIYNEDTLIQIDMGVSLKRVKEALSLLEKDISDIDGLLITHDHSDHIGTISYLKSISTYTADGNLKHIDFPIVPFKSVQIGSFDIMPLRTSHDATNPIGFLIIDKDETLLYMTDTGVIPEESLPYMKNHDYYIIESNHDLMLLEKSRRPRRLKDRIRGDHGHLSNADSAVYMSELLGNKTKAIYLAHLSEECNTPEKAVETYWLNFERLEVNYEGPIIPLWQYKITRGGHDEN